MQIVHKVESGENLNTIALLHHSSPHRIKAINGISSAKQGERLIVPILRGKLHIVKPFETMESIAKLYKVNLAFLKKYNQTNDTFVGDIIIIPKNAF